MKRSVICTVCILLAAACAERPEARYTTVVKDDAITSKLCGEVVYADSIVALTAWRLAGNKLAMLTPRTEGVIELWSWPQLRYEHSFVRTGRGPDEFLAVNWAESASDDRITLYDIPRRKIRSYSIQGDSLCRCFERDLIGANAQDQSMLKPYVNILQANDSVYLLRASDRTQDELSAVDLAHGNVLCVYDDILERDPGRDQYLAYDYLLKTNGRYIVKAYESLNRIEILELSDEYELIPRCVITDSAASGPQDLIYYNDIICAADWFACLFAGNSEGSGTVLELYDYGGKQLERIEVDRSLTHVLYDQKRHLFCGYDASAAENRFYLFRYTI